MNIPRMRTINETISIIKEEDKDSKISEYLIRQMCKKGKVHCIVTGNKYLINLDDLMEKLNGNLKIST